MMLALVHFWLAAYQNTPRTYANPKEHTFAVNNHKKE